MNAKDPFGLVGQTLDGQFRVEACIGEGGFSVVYRGTHLGLSEPVAIKCLKLPKGLPGHLIEPFLQRFRDESRILYKLSQGNLDIVRSVGAGNVVSNGSPVPYMVLEWLPGRSLAQELETRRRDGANGISIEALIGLMSSAAHAIGYAHSQGVIHRDLNPGNFFLVAAGGGMRLKVLDFGVAKIVSDHAIELGPRAPTMGQFKIFAPAYGAPEQFDERLGLMGPWTDVYSFAQVAVEVLRDRSALEGHSFAAFATATLDPARRPTPRLFGVPVAHEVESVFVRALCINPHDRYQELSEFWRALTVAVTSARASHFLAAAAAVQSLNLPQAPPPQAGAPQRSFPEIPRVVSSSDVPEPVEATAESSTAVQANKEIEALLARAAAAGFSVLNASDTHVEPTPSDAFADTQRAAEQLQQPHVEVPKTLAEAPRPAPRSVPRAAVVAQVHTLGLNDAPSAALRAQVGEPAMGSDLMYSALNANPALSSSEVVHPRTLALGGAQEPTAPPHRPSGEMPIASRILAGMAGRSLLDALGHEGSQGDITAGAPSTAREFLGSGSVPGWSVAAISPLAISGKVGGFGNDPMPLGVSAPLTTTLAMPHDRVTHAPSTEMRAATPVPMSAPHAAVGFTPPFAPLANGGPPVSPFAPLANGGAPGSPFAPLATSEIGAAIGAPPAWGFGNDALAEPSRVTQNSLPPPPPTSSAGLVVGLVIVAGLALAGLGGGVWVYFAHRSAQLVTVPSATTARAIEPAPALPSVATAVTPALSQAAPTSSVPVTAVTAPLEATAAPTIAPKDSARPEASAAPTTHATTVPSARPSAVLDPDEFDAKAAQTQLATYGNMLAACKQKDGAHGKSAAQVGFAHEGSVASVTLEPPFAGTKQASCITGLLRKAKVPAFTKGSGTTRYPYEIP